MYISSRFSIGDAYTILRTIKHTLGYLEICTQMQAGRHAQRPKILVDITGSLSTDWTRNCSEITYHPPRAARMNNKFNLFLLPHDYFTTLTLLAIGKWLPRSSPGKIRLGSGDATTSTWSLERGRLRRPPSRPSCRRTPRQIFFCSPMRCACPRETCTEEIGEVMLVRGMYIFFSSGEKIECSAEVSCCFFRCFFFFFF